MRSSLRSLSIKRIRFSAQKIKEINSDQRDTNEDVEDLAEYLDDHLDMTMLKTYSPWSEEALAFRLSHGWLGVPTEQFARLYAEKLGCSEKALKKGLWGDWFYHPKSKRIVREETQPEWKVETVVRAVHSRPDLETVRRRGRYYSGDKDLPTLAKSLKLTSISDKELTQSNKRMTLLAIMRSWLPLSSAILEMVVHSLLTS